MTCPECNKGKLRALEFVELILFKHIDDNGSLGPEIRREESDIIDLVADCPVCYARFRFDNKDVVDLNDKI